MSCVPWEQEGVAAAAKAWIGTTRAGGAAAARWDRAAAAAVAVLQVTDLPLPAAAPQATAAGTTASEGMLWPAVSFALAQATGKLHPQLWIAKTTGKHGIGRPPPCDVKFAFLERELLT